jgi:putative transposase
MTKPPRFPGQASPYATFFVTASTWQRREVFRSERMARLFIETLYHYRQQGVYTLHEFTIMPDHFHVLVSPALGVQIAAAVQKIKGGFSYRAGKETGSRMEIWQRGFTDHGIRMNRTT